MVSGHLSKELRAKYKKRTFGLHRGDTVKILIGKFKGKSGKIETVAPKENKIFIEGILVSKTSGTKAKVGIAASNVVITELNLDDKYRKKILESPRKSTASAHGSSAGVADKGAQKSMVKKEADNKNVHDAKKASGESRQ